MTIPAEYFSFFSTDPAFGYDWWRLSEGKNLFASAVRSLEMHEHPLFLRGAYGDQIARVHVKGFARFENGVWIPQLWGINVEGVDVVVECVTPDVVAAVCVERRVVIGRTR